MDNSASEWNAAKPVEPFSVRTLKDISKSLNAPAFSSGFRTALAPFERSRAPPGAVTTFPLMVQLPLFSAAAKAAAPNESDIAANIPKMPLARFFMRKIKEIVCENRKTIRGRAAGVRILSQTFPSPTKTSASCRKARRSRGFRGAFRPCRSRFSRRRRVRG